MEKTLETSRPRLPSFRWGNWESEWQNACLRSQFGPFGRQAVSWPCEVRTVPVSGSGWELTVSVGSACAHLVVWEDYLLVSCPTDEDLLSPFSRSESCSLERINNECVPRIFTFAFLFYFSFSTFCTLLRFCSDPNTDFGGQSACPRPTPRLLRGKCFQGKWIKCV